MTSPYNNFETCDITYEEELLPMEKKRPKTAAERSREYRERKKYMITKPPTRTSSERLKECRARQKAEMPPFEIANGYYAVVRDEKYTTEKKRPKTAAEHAKAYRDRKKGGTPISAPLKQVFYDVNLAEYETESVNDISNKLGPAAINKKKN